MVLLGYNGCNYSCSEVNPLNIQLTQLSSDEYERIRSGRMTPAMAAQYLKEERIVLRSFADTLRDMYPAEDLQLRLNNAFLAGCNEKKGSVERKVRNWLSGQNTPSSREDIFRIAFALGLSEAQANFLLGLCTEYGIHYRDGHDVIYAWFLRKGRNYDDAVRFYEKLPPIPDVPIADIDCTHLTHELQAAFQTIQSEAELERCYLTNLEKFGTLHRRAFHYFCKYLDQLICPSSALGEMEEPDYSMEALMDQYFSLKMPSGKNLSSYGVVQKLLKHNWPNATALKNIRGGTKDVPRKLLLLLYVITENVIDDDYHEMDEDYVTLEDRVEDHWYTLNAILADCGMPLLDPRNATDWLVLYAITADNVPMSERMEAVIDCMFNEHLQTL